MVYLTTLSAAQTVNEGATNDTMIKELERIWKEAVMAEFKVHYYAGIFLEGLRKTAKNLN
jgi:hypothetical protein